MKSHRTIIKAIGAQEVHDRLGLNGKINTVRAWMQRSSIPPEYWPRFIAAKIATAEELIMTAKERRRPKAMTDGLDAAA